MARRNRRRLKLRVIQTFALSIQQRVKALSAKERTIQVKISIGHAVHREARGHRRPAGYAIDFVDTPDCIHGFVDTVDQEAGHAMVD